MPTLARPSARRADGAAGPGIHADGRSASGRAEEEPLGSEHPSPWEPSPARHRRAARRRGLDPWCCSTTAVPGMSGGFVGVDVFFVISGYLITAITRGELGPRPLLPRRLLRAARPAHRAGPRGRCSSRPASRAPSCSCPRTCGSSPPSTRGLGAVRLEHPVLASRRRLLRRRHPHPAAAAAHVVAGRRGAVLPPLPAGADAAGAAAPCHGGGARGSGRAVLRARRLGNGAQPGIGLLPAARPRLGVAGRRAAGLPPHPDRAGAGRRRRSGERPRRHRARHDLLYRRHALPRRRRPSALPRRPAGDRRGRASAGGPRRCSARRRWPGSGASPIRSTCGTGP